MKRIYLVFHILSLILAPANTKSIKTIKFKEIG
jgi:hypothetical protein